MQHIETIEDPRVLVGLSALDDAGVIRTPGGDLLVQTVDFFTPIVDDPVIFGMAAAANSLSDVYAMGGTPLSALSVACFPDGKIPPEILAEIVRGAQIKLKEANCVLLGGHTVRDREVKFGFSVTGIVQPEHLMTKSGACDGDWLILTKAIGTGVLATACKKDKLRAEGLEALHTSLVRLNASAAHAACATGVRAATDVTGFGLIGHAFEIAKNSGLSLMIFTDRVPLLATAYELALDRSNLAGGLHRNRLYSESNLQIQIQDEALLSLLFDPQTSGGLLLAVNPDRKDSLIKQLLASGDLAAVIGRFHRTDPVAISLVKGEYDCQ